MCLLLWLPIELNFLPNTKFENSNLNLSTQTATDYDTSNDPSLDVGNNARIEESCHYHVSDFTEFFFLRKKKKKSPGFSVR